MADWCTDNLREYYATDQERLDTILYGNVLRLFPRLKAILED